MKKILSVILVLAMVLALGTTVFAADKEIEAGKTVGIKIENAKITVKDGVLISDKNGFLVIDTVVVADGFVAFNVTAPAGTEGKLAKLVVTDATKEKNLIVEYTVDITEPETPAAPTPEGVLDGDYTVADVVDNKATIEMAGYNGISAKLYNSLKSQNYESITFVGDGYAWTLTRGDYTKMNVTASIYFGAKIDYKLEKLDANNNVVRDTATENLVMKALGTTQADLFYVTIADNCNIGNVASKPALVVTVEDSWINFNNKFSVTAYKFDGEAVAKVAEGLAVKPTTGKLTLNLTTAGTYVFVADNYTVNPTPSTSEKPNSSTGANSAAAVVALAVMAVAAVASKKIVK